MFYITYLSGYAACNLTLVESSDTSRNGASWHPSSNLASPFRGGHTAIGKIHMRGGGLCPDVTSPPQCPARPTRDFARETRTGGAGVTGGPASHRTRPRPRPPAPPTWRGRGAIPGPIQARSRGRIRG